MDNKALIKKIGSLAKLVDLYRPLIRDDSDFYGSIAVDLRARLQRSYYEIEAYINKACGGTPHAQIFGHNLPIFETAFSEANSTASFHTIKHVHQLLQKCIVFYTQTHKEDMSPTKSPPSPIAGNSYVSNDILQLAQKKRDEFNYKKLANLCEELNFNFSNSNPYSSLNLIRAILDHVPPLLGHGDFSSLANHYSWPTQADRLYIMSLLNDKNISHDSLHRPISQNEDLIRMEYIPNPIYINTLLKECLTKTVLPGQKQKLLSQTRAMSESTSKAPTKLSPDSPLVTATLHSFSGGPDGTRVEVGLENIGKSVAILTELRLGNITQTLKDYQPLNPGGTRSLAIQIGIAGFPTETLKQPLLVVLYHNAITREEIKTVYEVSLEHRDDKRYNIRNFTNPKFELAN